MEREIAPMLSQVFQEMGWSSVKPEQKEVVGSYSEDGCFCYSSSGLGKSACNQCLLYPGSDSAIIVVVSPLKAFRKVALLYFLAICFIVLLMLQVSALSMKA